MIVHEQPGWACSAAAGGRQMGLPQPSAAWPEVVAQYGYVVSCMRLLALVCKAAFASNPSQSELDICMLLFGHIMTCQCCANQLLHELHGRHLRSVLHVHTEDFLRAILLW